MDKQKASLIVNNQLGSSLLNPNRNGNVSWANINIAKDVWWIDIPVKKFKSHFHLILNDARYKRFYWISINKNEITYPYNYFRKLREKFISIELSSRETNIFIDVKSGGTEFDFNKFQIKEFDYSKTQEIKVNPKDHKIKTVPNRKTNIYLDSPSVQSLENEMASLFEQLSTVQRNIQAKLEHYCDNKTLKGNEVVGWLGEIYGKLLFKGIMVDDSYEHDIETSEGKRISIKTRKGWKSGWTQSSAIPKIVGNDCPTHLLFVHLNDDYSIHGMWLFDWSFLTKNERFRKHMVRGNLRSYIFHLNETKDQDYKIFP